MVPDTCLRLSAVVKALDDIITPALPPEASFAHEQLALIKASIRIAIDQIPHEQAFAVRDAQDCLALARSLAPFLPSASTDGQRLHEAIDRMGAATPSAIVDRPDFERHLRAFKCTLESVSESLCAKATGDALREIQALILDHSARQTLRERAWAKATGFELDPAAIPPVETLIYAPAVPD